MTNGAEMDITNGQIQTAITLQPFNPSSPPRKKARGGNLDRRSEKKTDRTFFLNLEEDNWARYYLVKQTAQEGSFSQTCSFKLNKIIKGILGKVKSIKKQGDGSICIEAETRAQAKILENTTKFGEIEVIVSPHVKLNSSQGVITCRDFLNSSIEDIKEGLVQEGVIDVRRIKRRQGEELVDTASLVLTFNKPKPPSMIEAAFYKLKVRPYIPSPLRCYRCQLFGHTSLRCKATEQVCVCGKQQHEGECTPPPVCVNCKGDHNARSPSCPVLIKEKEIQKIKTLQQLPYHEAKSIVESKYYITPEISFAKKVTKTPAMIPINPTPIFGPFPALKEKIIEVGETPPPKIISPEREKPALRLATPPPSTSGVETKVGFVPPQTITTSLVDAWQLVSRPQRSPKKKEKEEAVCSQPTDSLIGSDLDMSESESGQISERPPTTKRNGRSKGKTRRKTSSK